MAKTTYGLMDKARDELAKRFLERKARAEGAQVVPVASFPAVGSVEISDAFCRFDRHPGYEKLQIVEFKHRIAAGEQKATVARDLGVSRETL